MTLLPSNFNLIVLILSYISLHRFVFRIFEMKRKKVFSIYIIKPIFSNMEFRIREFKTQRNYIDYIHHQAMIFIEKRRGRAKTFDKVNCWTIRRMIRAAIPR